LEKLEKIKIVVDSVRNGKEEINKYFLSNWVGLNRGCNSKR
jgi:hypothetical protein